MPSDSAKSPFAFLTALSGESATDRQIVAATRGVDVKIVSHMVLASKVSTLYAFSGNGKSSLINAGLIPAFVELGYAVFRTRPRPPYALSNPIDGFKQGCIRDHRLPAASDDRFVLLTEARQQLDGLPQDALPGVRRLVERFALDRTLTSTVTVERSASLADHLRKHADRPLAEFLAQAREFLGAAVPLVVICDQFEELFVHHYNSPALRAFAEELRDLCDAQDLQVHILFSMREDWVGSMITLRDVIPDILNNAYRLDPMRLSAASPALTLAAEAAGATVSPDVVGQILHDLAAFYRHEQRIVGVPHMTPSVQSDPFIELPALQVVGERLWKTKGSSSELTAAHYRALTGANTGRAGSPAAAVLERYLADTLDTIDAGDGREAADARDLRVDALYLLTDKAAHRRALSEPELLGELRAIRAGTASATDERATAQTDQRSLQAAIKPLVDERLILITDGGSDGRRYELAHDFMVRSIVRAWNALDRRRAEERGFLEERRRHEAERLETLSRMVDRGNRVFFVFAGLTLLALLAFAVALMAANGSYLGPTRLTGLTIQLVILTLAGGILATGIILRSPLALIFACAAWLACYAPPRIDQTWPVPTFLFNQWLLVLLCLIPALRFSRMEQPLPAATAHRRQVVAELSLDYGFFPLVVAVGMSSSGDIVSGPLWLAFALVVLQVLFIIIRSETLGQRTWSWVNGLATSTMATSGNQRPEDSDVEEPLQPGRIRRIFRFLRLPGGYALLLLVPGVSAATGWLWSLGNPVYFSLHAALIALLIRMGRMAPPEEPAG